jgi:hypothetical protein
MSDLQDLIASSSIRAFKHGMQHEREHTLELIQKHKIETKCDCPGCESWTNAFEFLAREIRGEVID